MKLNVDIAAHYLEETVIIQAPKTSPSITRLIGFINDLENKEKISLKKGDTIYLVDTKKVYRCFTENRQMIVRDEKDSYRTDFRLYQLKDLLGDDFLQISQSEIINSRYIERLNFTPNGLVQLFLGNGDVTYSSRRYLKTIKEKLEC